jgi:hypothetical protein
MPRVADVVDDNELRVSKLSSFFSIAPSRSSETEATSLTIRGSRSPDAICAKALRPKPDTTETTTRPASAALIIPFPLRVISVVSGFSRTVVVIPVVSGFSRTVIPVVSGFSRTVVVILVVSGFSRTVVLVII